MATSSAPMGPQGREGALARNHLALRTAGWGGRPYKAYCDSLLSAVPLKPVSGELGGQES